MGKSDSSGRAKVRIEKDYLGEMEVPADAYYSCQTQRAVENFRISGIRFSRPMIAAVGMVKNAAAIVNKDLGLLEPKIAEVVIKAAEEVKNGVLDEQFVVDVFQTGSGTSTNMNANEVIASRASELSGGSIKVHPNDHSNMSQSSNDIIPTAIHIAIALEITNRLVPGLEKLKQSLEQKVNEFSGIVKTGRTHLQDATPITLGQEFSGYQSQIEHSVERLKRSLDSILELPLGGCCGCYSS